MQKNVPDELDRISDRQERQGAKVFFRALKTQYAAMARQVENGQEPQPDEQIVKNALISYHFRVQLEMAEWQYNDLLKRNPVKALQVGIQERLLGQIKTWVALNIGTSIKSISATSLEQVRRMIAEGQEQGWGARKIAAQIRAEAKGQFTAYRSTVISRTEGTRAASQGAKIGAEQWESITGQKKWKAWSAANQPGRTRDQHIEMVGTQPIPGDVDFIVGGQPMDGPGDPRGGKANVINCRCRRYYMSERMALQQIAQNGGRVPGVYQKPAPTSAPPMPTTVTPTVTPIKPGRRVKPVTPPPPPVVKPTPIPMGGPRRKPMAPTKPSGVTSSRWTPDKMEAFERQHDVKIDREIFDMLGTDIPMVHRTGGSYYSPDAKLVNIDTTRDRSKWNKQSVVYHEYGHAIDWNRGLRFKPEVQAVMEKYRKQLRAGKNQGFMDLHTQVRKDSILARSLQDAEQIGAFADTLMSLNPKYGYGHTTTYFSHAGKKEAEFIAHCFENAFIGNPYFKRVAPELYDDMIKFIETLK